MKNLVKLSLLALVISSFTACCDDSGICVSGEGKHLTQTLDLEDFSAIQLSESAHVTIVQGNQQKVVATGHENIIDLLKTNVHNGEWDINLPGGCYRSYDLDIEITIPNLERIDLSGSGDIIVSDFNDINDLEVVISGSGEVVFEDNITLETLDARISGSGEIRCNTSPVDLTYLQVKISGSGDLDAYEFHAKDCDINISGSGKCFVTATDNLDVKISGSGSVFYHGNPSVNTQITGSGKVKKTD